MLLHKFNANSPGFFSHLLKMHIRYLISYYKNIKHYLKFSINCEKLGT